jgi:hypothetical protein
VCACACACACAMCAMYVCVCVPNQELEVAGHIEVHTKQSRIWPWSPKARHSPLQIPISVPANQARRRGACSMYLEKAVDEPVVFGTGGLAQTGRPPNTIQRQTQKVCPFRIA